MSTSAQDYNAASGSLGTWYPPPYSFPENSTSPVLASSRVAAVGNCRLYGFTVTSSNVANQFVQVFDAVAVPANGAVPILTVNVLAANAASAYWGSVGRWFDRGIVLVNSTTQVTLTIGAADCIFDVQFIF